MKILLIMVSLFFSIEMQAQFTKASLQASGLTCSMCSNAINKSLQSLNFVESVDADISTSTFEVSFTPGVTVDLNKIRKKVEDAGFFIANFSATVSFKQQSISNNEHLTVSASNFHFLNVNPQVLNGEVVLILLDKHFISPKKFKQNLKLKGMECLKAGVLGNPCEVDKIPTEKRVYHVTI